MKQRIIISLIFLSSIAVAFSAGLWVRGNFMTPKTPSESSLVNKIIPKPLEAYSIDNLAKESYPAGTLSYTKNLLEDDKYTSDLFSFKFKPNPESRDLKTTSVVVNKPLDSTTDKFPLVFMIRGYVDPGVYSPGTGTRRAAEVFVKNSFITVAPDFLGYGESDLNSSNIFESRFQTYTTVLALLSSLNQIPEWDGKNVFIWAHSNGGQITLTTLVVTGKNYPTVLWAPVTKPFPYSVLYYTDTSEDRGKLIRRELAKFEDVYDTDKFSFDLHLDKIQSNLQLHQGSADDLVPQAWSDELVKSLKNKDKDIEYYIYPGGDHNLQPGWNTAVERSLEFYQQNLQD